MVIDSGLVQITCGMDCYWWAKASLWKTKIFGIVMDSLRCIKVNRRINGEKMDNNILYKASFDILNGKNLLCVFPEGTSYTLPHPLKFKHGLSKIALEHAKKNKTNVYPVCITYLEKSRFRSKVIVYYGKSVEIDENLTKNLEKSILDISISAPEWIILNSSKNAFWLLFKFDPSLYIKVVQCFIIIFQDLKNHVIVEPLMKRCLEPMIVKKSFPIIQLLFCLPGFLVLSPCFLICVFLKDEHLESLEQKRVLLFTHFLFILLIIYLVFLPFSLFNIVFYISSSLLLYTMHIDVFINDLKGFLTTTLEKNRLELINDLKQFILNFEINKDEYDALPKGPFKKESTSLGHFNEPEHMDLPSSDYSKLCDAIATIRNLI